MPILSSIIEKDIAIDLGTDTTILYVAGIGIRLREPTVVTIDRTTGRVLKVGEDARKMLGRTPGNLVSVHPIAAGVISDYDMTCEMLREFIRRVTSLGAAAPGISTAPTTISAEKHSSSTASTVE